MIQLKSDSYNMRTFIAIFFLILLFPAYSQENGTFSPFVTNLTAKANEMNIILTWQNPEGIQGKLLIYRYTEEITKNNLEYAQLLMLADISKNSFTDSPTNTKEYFYAVLIQDISGMIHKVFAPYRNKTVTGVRIEELAPEDELATVITNLQAKVSGDTIVISFQSSKPERSVLLYRSTQPLVDEDSLLRAITPVSLGDYSYSYTDYPIAGIDYYYAVLDAGLIKIGDIKLYPGQNSLKNPVTIPLRDDSKMSESKSQRSLPLPYLDIISDVEFGEDIISSVSSYLPEEKKLKESTKKIIESLLKNTTIEKKKIVIDPVIIPIDLAESTGGESSILQKIISEYFSKGLYYKAEKQLRDYLRIKHSKDIEARSYFYLGQIFYFKSAFKDAFLAFLMAIDPYYTEIQPWLDICFTHIMENQ